MESYKNNSKTNKLLGAFMESRKNEKGIALITTLILGLVALTFIGALLYMLTSESTTSGISKRYSTALEAAKGASEYVISSLLADTLECSTPDGSIKCKCIDLDNDLVCPGASNSSQKAIKVVLPSEYSNLDDYKVDVTLLAKEIAEDTADEKVEIYSFKITSQSARTREPEKAEINFVYKLTTEIE